MDMWTPVIDGKPAYTTLWCQFLKTFKLSNNGSSGPRADSLNQKPKIEVAITDAPAQRAVVTSDRNAQELLHLFALRAFKHVECLPPNWFFILRMDCAQDAAQEGGLDATIALALVPSLITRAASHLFCKNAGHSEVDKCRNPAAEAAIALAAARKLLVVKSSDNDQMLVATRALNELAQKLALQVAELGISDEQAASNDSLAMGLEILKTYPCRRNGSRVVCTDGAVESAPAAAAALWAVIAERTAQLFDQDGSELLKGNTGVSKCQVPKSRLPLFESPEPHSPAAKASWALALRHADQAWKLLNRTRPSAFNLTALRLEVVGAVDAWSSGEDAGKAGLQEVSEAALTYARSAACLANAVKLDGSLRHMDVNATQSKFRTSGSQTFSSHISSRRYLRVFALATIAAASLLCSIVLTWAARRTPGTTLHGCYRVIP